jgi:phosphatidylserine decarboxylase
MTIAREAWPFVLPPAAAALLLVVLGWPKSAAALAIVSVGVLLFFRVPKRRSSAEADIVLAAANGLVTRIDQIDDRELMPEPCHRIVTFLSVFDVHAQRSPVAGRVERSLSRRGRKIAAFRTEAGTLNESHLTAIRTPSGDLVGVRQIAGLVARRIVCYVDEGDVLERGDPIGIIKFGSRVDLLVPERYALLVTKGQRVTEGSTPVARRPE